MGKNVLISNYGEYYRLAQFLFRYSKQPIALAMGAASLKEIFTEKYYEQLPGGILESFGRLFKNDLCLYVSPALNVDGTLVNLENLEVPDNPQHLFQHLTENRYLRPLNSINHDYLSIYSHDVISMIQQQTSDWENKCPQKVVELIKAHHLFQK